MSERPVARRYASALFDLARSRGEVDAWLSDLAVIRSRLGEPSVVTLLNNPEAPFAAKKAVIDQALGRLEQLRRNFAYVLVTNNRLRELEQIVEHFRRLAYERQGVRIAEVTTAVPLTDSQAQVVARQIERLTGRQIVLEQRVDPLVLGGVVAQIGDRRIDLSIAGQLAALREHLAQ